MKHLTASFFVLVLTSLLSQKLDPVTKPKVERMKSSDLDVDSLYTEVHQTGDSILTSERRSYLIIESEKKSLELTINILKRRVDSLQNEIYKKDL